MSFPNEPVPPAHLGALLVQGSDVTQETLDYLSIALELLAEQVDRELRPDDGAGIRWKTVEMK